MVASDTPPVQEVIEAGKEGLLVDFFDSDGLAARVDELLGNPDRRQYLGKRARQTILERGYDLETCLQKQLALIDKLMA